MHSGTRGIEGKGKRQNGEEEALLEPSAAATAGSIIFLEWTREGRHELDSGKADRSSSGLPGTNRRFLLTIVFFIAPQLRYALELIYGTVAKFLIH